MSMWEQDRYVQVDALDGDAGGRVVGEVDARPRGVAAEAEADRAAGLPTFGTRGYADTEAFERDGD
jgi:hypothetical protein